MRFFNHYKYIIASVLCLVACNSNSDNYSTYSARDMIVYLTDSISAPEINNFKQSVSELNDSIQALSNQASNQELETIQEIWKTTVLSLKSLETAYVGIVSESFIMNKVYSLPEISRIEELLNTTDDVNGTLFLQKVASKNRGLLTLDYLLFQQNSLVLYNSRQRYRDVLKRLSTLLLENSIQLIHTFKTHHQSLQHASGRYNTDQDILTEYINSIVLQIEDYRDKTIGEVTGVLSNNITDASKIEARYSQLSKQTLLISISGLKVFFYGNDVYGFDDLLKDRGSDTSEKFLTILTNLEASINQLPDNFETGIISSATEFKSVYNQLTSLLRHIKTDIANHLSVTVGLSDNDGD